MTPPQSIDAATPRTDPFRWQQQLIAATCGHFDNPDHATSQRQYANQHGIPRSTLGSWLRQTQPEGVEHDLACFFRSACGLRFLRRLVAALFVVFLFRGACGLRLLSAFLQLTQLDRFVASSTGALHQLSLSMQSDLAAFADEERPRLAEGMKHRHIALVPDENFHGPQICLVAAEPASNFLFVEQYADRRDEAAWATAIEQSVAGLPVTVLVLCSDRAKALIACAHNDLAAHHLAELFHGQRDLCQPLMGPLGRHNEAAHKELRAAQEQLDDCRMAAQQARTAPVGPGRPKEHDKHIARSEARLEEAVRELKRCEDRKEQALEAIRGLADDFHPFDRTTGAAVKEAQTQKRLQQRLQALETVAEQAELSSKAGDALERGKRWIEELTASMAWFWSTAQIAVEELDLPEEAETVMNEKLLPGLYWQAAARRGRTQEERKQREELAERLLEEAWTEGGELSQLGAADQEAVKRVGREIVGLFARSSSCVEGRNGRLSLFHHGQTRLSAGRLKALTVVHNYHTSRADGTTAAERFFGKKPRNLFDWLLQRLPDLPRPAAKRPKKAAQPTATGG